MNFIKKYSVLLIPVGILLLAVIVFVFVFLSAGSLANQINDESISQYESIKSSLNKTPSAKQPDEEAAYQALHEKDAEAISNMAKQSTMRELIRYEIFPKPLDTSYQIFTEYGDDYRVQIEQLVKSMDALDAPSDTEIDNETGGGGGRSSRGGGSGDNSALVDAVCRRRSDDIQVYANPTVFKWYDFWADYEVINQQDSLKDCWYSQLAFWIYKDVTDTIIAMNSGSQRVTESPVKRLLGVSFEETVGYDEQSSGRRMGVSVADRPMYILPGVTSVLEIDPWAGRTGNDDIDVVHFSTAVVVRAQDVMSFMKELCGAKTHTFKEGYSAQGEEKTYQHNQITILQSKIEPIEREDPLHEYYRYGDEAVIRLNLICEYIFNRHGYDEIKPESVKEDLGQVVQEEEKADSAGSANGSKAKSGSGKSRRNR